MHRRVAIATRGPGFSEFTGALRARIEAAAPGAAQFGELLIQENADPAVRRDLTEALHRLVPPSDRPESGWMSPTVGGRMACRLIGRRRCCRPACRFPSFPGG